MNQSTLSVGGRTVLGGFPVLAVLEFEAFCCCVALMLRSLTVFTYPSPRHKTSVVVSLMHLGYFHLQSCQKRAVHALKHFDIVKQPSQFDNGFKQQFCGWWHRFTDP